MRSIAVTGDQLAAFRLHHPITTSWQVPGHWALQGQSKIQDKPNAYWKMMENGHLV
jgi:hypothetical protein